MSLLFNTLRRFVIAFLPGSLLQGHGHYLQSPGGWSMLAEVLLEEVGTQPHPSAENWIKDLLSMALV